MTPAQKTIVMNVDFDTDEALIFLGNLTEEVEANLISREDAIDRLQWFRENLRLFCRFTVA